MALCSQWIIREERIPEVQKNGEGLLNNQCSRHIINSFHYIQSIPAKSQAGATDISNRVSQWLQQQEMLEKNLESLAGVLRSEMVQLRQENSRNARDNREESANRWPFFRMLSWPE
jgi:hypothetical protein